MKKSTDSELIASLQNPFASAPEREFGVPGQVASQPGLYEKALKAGWELQQRPLRASGVRNTQRQHQKKRMTIWERIEC
ncbi:MAG TPA: acetyl-CoA carboxylase carboxyltransferase subunit, partial [Haliea salexigens]|nr:acetyl-CoA carboxylase carboxyltransferase subunit [Haliea salexigens]